MNLQTNDVIYRMAVLHRGALGDFILTLPVYQGLKRLYPNLKLDFWSRPAHVDLVRECSYFGGFRSADSDELNAFLFAPEPQSPPLPAPLARADHVLLFGQSSLAEMAVNLRNRLTVPVHWIHSFVRTLSADEDPLELFPSGTGKPVTTDPFPEHVADYLLAQVRRLGFDITGSSPKIVPPSEETAAVTAWLKAPSIRARRWIALHPGSGGTAKIWPLARWEALITWLTKSRSANILIIIGPDDERLAAFARETASRHGCVLADQIGLGRLAALLSAVDLYVGNDSGVTHLAAASGVPTVAIFGPASHRIWEPRGPHVHIHHSQWNPDDTFVSHSQPVRLSPELHWLIEAALSSKNGVER